MLYYTYDGSYEGILCTIQEALKNSEPPFAIRHEAPEVPPLFCQMRQIPSDAASARAYADFLRVKTGKDTPAYLYYGNLADLEEAPLWLYEYVQLGLSLGKDLNRYLAEERVRRIHRLQQQVLGERHRLLGLTRFQRLSSGIYYAQIRPDHRVLALMAPHFAARLPQERWLLHDTKRGWAAAGENGHFQLLPLASEIKRPKEDEIIANLWQQYYAHIAIVERANPRQQAQYMPRRYWDNLTEKPGTAQKTQNIHRETCGNQPV